MGPRSGTSDGGEQYRPPELAGFEIVEILGSGGMGTVYRAVQKRLRRSVALKFLHPSEGSSSRKNRRLLSEARAASALEHPGIVKVYDLAEADGYDVLVMELVDGTPLDRLLARGPLPWPEAVALAADLAGALACAHGAGIVHRDLKPSNVMVLAGPLDRSADRSLHPGGRIKLLDFGIAASTQAGGLATWTDGESCSRAVDSGSSGSPFRAPGTLAYMAPEQILGSTVDARSDQFSFGVVLFEMLAGRRPFRAAADTALARRIVLEPPDSLRDLRPEVSGEIVALVERTLAKDCADRFASMAEVGARCRSQLPASDRKTDAPPDSATGVEAEPDRFPSPGSLASPLLEPRASPVPRRQSSLPAPLVVLVALVVLVGGSLGLVLVRSPASDGRISIDGGSGPSSARSTGEPALAEPPSAPEVVESTPYAHYQAGMAKLERFERAGWTESAISSFEAALELNPDYAPAWKGLAEAHWQKYRASREPLWSKLAEQHVARALALAPLLHEAQIVRARIWTAQGRLDESEVELERLRVLAPENLDVEVGLAEVAMARRDFSAAASRLRRAAERWPDHWQAHGELGRALLASWDLEGSEGAFRSALARAPDNSFLRHNLGAVLHYQGRYGEAIRELQASLEIWPTSRGYSNLGTAYFFEGRYLEAVEALEAARNLGANYYVFWGNLGDAYRQVPGRRKEAIPCFSRAIQLIRPMVRAEPRNPTLRSRLAVYLVKAGKPDAALRELGELGALADHEAAVSFRAALVLELAGRRSEALGALALALERGYPVVEVRNEPELARLRADVELHQLLVPYDDSESDSPEPRSAPPPVLASPSPSSASTGPTFSTTISGSTRNR